MIPSTTIGRIGRVQTAFNFKAATPPHLLRGSIRHCSAKSPSLLRQLRRTCRASPYPCFILCSSQRFPPRSEHPVPRRLRRRPRLRSRGPMSLLEESRLRQPPTCPPRHGRGRGTRRCWRLGWRGPWAARFALVAGARAIQPGRLGRASLSAVFATRTLRAPPAVRRCTGPRLAAAGFAAPLRRGMPAARPLAPRRRTGGVFRSGHSFRSLTPARQAPCVGSGPS